ncbi:MAG: carbamoylphosphate synthase large subunit [Candidatus Saccharibacteria bacterium]|nr:carbamoylphosphate synthase large subunit [Candidatus Saccharibacteria bacterium]
MKKKILVYPCGSEIGLEIYKSVAHSIHIELFGGSAVDDHGKLVYENYIGGLPFVDDPSFVEKLNQVVRDNNIDYIFPAHDSVVLLLAQEKAAGTLDCDVITSPLEACVVARSKKQTYQTLGDLVPTARQYEADQVAEADFPLFLKPDVGQGSKGTQLVHNLNEMAFYLEKDPTLLILDYLPGAEYTIDCFTNKNGELLYAAGRERKRISNGISVHSEFVQDERFAQLAAAINGRLPFRGGWFFQVKARDDGELVLMEIATRIAGTMGLSRGRGTNLPLLSVYDAMGYDVEVLTNNYEVIIDRALENRFKLALDYSHVYLDFDDMVIREGKVNVQVMAFVYQCHNQNIPVHLITRHKDDLAITLAQYHLESSFTSHIWLTDEADEKYNYIREDDAIFIDDSFAERKKVQEHCHVPVFDAHMIECLMS